MRLLLDINVVLDVLLEREEFIRESGALLSAVEAGGSEDTIVGYIAGHTVTTIHYLVKRARGREAAGTAVADLLRVARVVPLELVDFAQALAMDSLGVKDFEDAVQAAAALKIGADFLVTRDRKDFQGVPGLQARTPGEILALL
jgi:predicted nucleic acid-binding protein